MRFKENDLIAEAYAKVNEAKKKPSAGLTKKQKSDVAKKARAGKDIGKKGPGFAKMAKAAGGGEKGKKIAAAAMWKSIKRESADILTAYEGKKLLSESVTDDQYESVVDIIHRAINDTAAKHPELSAEINEVWDVVTELWANYEHVVLNTIMGEGMGESSVPSTLDESDPMIPKVEKIIQKMTEEYGSEERAIEELSKWDEDDMNEYYNNHIMSEEAEEEEEKEED